MIHSAASMLRRVLDDPSTRYRQAPHGVEAGGVPRPEPTAIRLATLLRRPLRPRLDVWESDTAYTVVADLPGVPRDAIQVLAGSDRLVISGERPVDAPRDARAQREERRVGRFERTVQLGRDARPENANVRLEAGVLEIRIPKGPGARGEARKIDLPPS